MEDQETTAIIVNVGIYVLGCACGYALRSARSKLRKRRERKKREARAAALKGA